MANVIQGIPVNGSTATVASSSAGGLLKIALSSGSTAAPTRWHLSEVAWSVNSPPVVDQVLTVYDGSTTAGVIFQLAVGSSGHDALAFPPLRGSAGNAMTVTLSTGGGSTPQYLNVFAYRSR